MKIVKKKYFKYIKCNECGRDLKEVYSIVGKHSKNELLLCDDCFVEFKREISEMWIQY